MIHPELTRSLADQHRGEVTSRAVALRAGRLQAGKPRSRARRGLVPGYRVTWTRLSLAPAGAGRHRAWVIVISATPAH